MAEPSAGFQEKMRGLQLRYAAKLRGKLQEVGQQLQLCRAEAGNAELQHGLYRQLHSLAGSAGTFGFSEIGTQARAIEMALVEWMKAGPPAATHFAQVDQALQAMLVLLPVEQDAVGLENTPAGT